VKSRLRLFVLVVAADVAGCCVGYGRYSLSVEDDAMGGGEDVDVVSEEGDRDQGQSQLSILNRSCWLCGGLSEIRWIN